MTGLTFKVALVSAVAALAAAADPSVVSASNEVPFVLPSYCEPTAYDIVQVQDMTSSFDTKWDAMSKQIAKVINSIYQTDRNSRFGFATFGDKPRHNDTTQYGYDSDYCLKVDIPLSRPSADDMTKLFSDYTAHAGGGGADWPEALSDGLMRALMTRKLDWAENAENSTRLVVVVTDAMTHLRGDLAKLHDGKQVRDFDLKPEDVADSPNNLCGEMEYPDWDQMGDLITQHNANVIVLAAPAGQYDSNGKFTPYKPIALMGKKYRDEDGLALLYQDFFQAHNVPAFVQKLNQDMSNYADAFVSQFHHFMQWHCDQQTSTPAPVSTGTTEKEQDPDGVDTTLPTSTSPATTSAFLTTPLPTEGTLTDAVHTTTHTPKVTSETTPFFTTLTPASTPAPGDLTTSPPNGDGTPAPPCDDNACGGCCGGSLHADIHIVIDDNAGCQGNDTDSAAAAVQPIVEVNNVPLTVQ